jgi:choline transport protein
VSSVEWAPLLSWVCGWINIVGWVFLVGTANSFSAFMIGGIAAMMNPVILLCPLDP